MQVAQAKVLETYLITGVFKATSMSALNMKVYLTLICYELDIKVD